MTTASAQPASVTAPRAADDSPIRIRGLTKRFGRLTALDGLDLTVAAGSVHGFLGPNGAGKSTTIRVLLGLYRPDAGEVRVLGRDPGRSASAINREISYVPGDVALWPNLTGGQVLDVLAGLRGARDRAREEDLIERLDLDPSKKVRTYSKGNRQKVALVAALAAPTRLLVLDEPTSGLDPLMERVFTEEVSAAASAGRTVLLSSHILAEVQRLCSAVTIIKDGRVVEHGDLEHLQSLAATRIELRAGPERLVSLRSALAPRERQGPTDPAGASGTGTHGPRRRRRAAGRGCDLRARESGGPVPAPLRGRPMSAATGSAEAAPSSGRAAGAEQPLSGLGRATGLMVRRLRVQACAWVLPLWALAAATPSYESVYPSLQSRTMLIEAMRASAGTRLLYGILPLPGTIGQLAQWEIGSYLVVCTGLMAVLLTCRTLRADEDEGLVELLRGAGAGRRVPFLAPVGVVTGIVALHATGIGLLMTILTGRVEEMKV